MIELPAAILIIFGLLLATFNCVEQAILILLNVPFALVGGIAALWLRGLNFASPQRCPVPVRSGLPDQPETAGARMSVSEGCARLPVTQARH